MKRTVLLIVLWVTSISVSFGQLPRDHAYQNTLINYLGTLEQSDFDLTLAPLSADPSNFNSIEEVYKTWLFFGYEQQDMMATRGLRTDASLFTLDAIEANGQVNMTVGHGLFMNPTATAFWADWDYEGNPHYDSRAVKLRAFVASAVDMIMQDQDHERGNNRRSDFLGFQLIRWSYAYGVAKDELPQNVRNAFEKGLIKMFEKLEQWGPTGIHADMDMTAIVGMLYAAKFVDSQNLTSRAHNHIDLILDKHLKDPGYIDHGGTYDAGYTGTSLYFLNWAAQLSKYPPVINALKKMSTLKAYMTLPDPDGKRFSPFHSNSSSGHDAPHDIWSPYSRDVGIAKFSDNAKYLVYNGSRENIFNQSAMLDQMNGMLQYFHSDSHESHGAFLTPSNDTPGPWKHEHWIDANSLNPTAFYYEDGLFDKLSSLKNSNSKLKKPPFERSESFTKSFSDKFLSVKRQSYGTIIFNDRLSWWTGEGQTEMLNGFGGGNLSAFWTPSTGSVILGGTRTAHNDGLDLRDWALWPVHALSGETADGRGFSSGLQRYPEATYKLSGDTKQVSIVGDLTNSYADPRDGLNGNANYKRIFNIKENGVEVTTSVVADGTNSVRDLYEILPVYRRDAYHQGSLTPTSIEFKVNGNWQQAGTTVKTVTNIRLSRFNGQVYIDFKEPARVKLSSKDFYQNPVDKLGLQARNIMIDMLGTNGQSTNLENSSVTYFLRSSNAAPNETWGGGDDDSNNKKSDTTPPEIEISHSPGSPSSTEGVNFSAEATDAGGIQQIQIYVDGAEAQTCTDTETCSVSTGPYSAGTYSYYASASDNSGNQVESSGAEFTVTAQDTKAPKIQISHSPENPDETQKITIETTASDGSGIDNIEVFVEDEKAKTCEDQKTCEVNLGTRREGSYGYYAKATDTDGNEVKSAEKVIEVLDVDESSPEIELSHSPENPDNTQDITVKASASDNEGISTIVLFAEDEKVKTCEDQENCSVNLGSRSEGTYQYYATVTDVNGNETTSSKAEVAVYTKDEAPPEVELSHTPGSPDDTQDITVKASASDNEGISTLVLFAEDEKVKTCEDQENCSVNLGSRSEGTYQYYAKVTDINGNKVTSSKQEITVHAKDTIPPEVEISHSPEKPDDTEEVTFIATASDENDIKKIEILIDTAVEKTCTNTNKCEIVMEPFEVGTHSYSARAEDKSTAGKQAKAKEKTFKVTAKPPPNSPPVRIEAMLVKKETYLESEVENVSDPDGDEVNLTFDWRVNEKSIAMVNMPLDVDIKAKDQKTVKNYTRGQNDGEISASSEIPGWTEEGKKGGAFRFDGIDDYIKIPVGNETNRMQQFTVETWIKRNNWGDTDAALISKAVPGSSEKKNSSVFKLTRNGDKNNIDLQIIAGENESFSIQSQNSIAPGTWAHVVGTYDGNKLSIYINGELDNSKKIGKTLINSDSTDILIGKASDNAVKSSHFKGMLDEIKVFNVSLSARQIEYHYKLSYQKLSLSETHAGQAWQVAISANDSKSSGESVTSNTIKTTKSDETKQGEGSKTSLAQNYPNPFSNSTTIPYTLKTAQKITIKIFDSTGQLVETIYEGEESAGPGTKPLEASHLASGLYFYQLITNEGAFAKKMILVK